MNDAMTSAEAGAIAGRARKLLRAGELTHHELALLDALLWSCRRAGASTARVSYSQLQKAAHLARSTVASGLVVLEKLGLIQRTRHRVLAVGANGGRVWRQLPSVYRLLAISRESAGRTDSKPQDLFSIVRSAPSEAVRAAQRALARIADKRSALLAEEWRHRR